MEQQFDALKYFEKLGKSNRLAVTNKFVVDYCSGPEGLDAAMANYRTASNFIFIDDTTSANTFNNKVSWFDRNVNTVFIIAGYNQRKENDREEKLRLCRAIFRQFLSKIIYDKQQYVYGGQMVFLDTSSVYSTEFGRYSFNGATGLWFQIRNDEPVDLVYHQEEWM